MHTIDLLDEFEQLGVHIWREGDALKFEAPDGVMTPERINLLKQHKADLLAHLCADGAPMIEPLDHSNDAPVLTGLQQRALNGFLYLMDKAKQNLIKNDYPIDNAMVRREQWRDAVMRTLHINRDQMDRIETELYQCGAIDYAASRLYIVAGDGQTKTIKHSQADNPDFLLSDDTGATFRQWLYH